jgi:hypothetical protein
MRSRLELILIFVFNVPVTTPFLPSAVGLAAALVCVGLVVGCAADLARASSGAIGCPHAAIDVEDISVGWSETSWTARCRGLVFHCSGEDAPSCAPELDVTERPAPEPPADTTQGRPDVPQYP